MKRFTLIAAAVLGLAGVAPAWAQYSSEVDSIPAPTRFKIFGAASWVSPLAESDQNLGGVTDAVGASSEVGYNFGLEFRPGPMFGIEFDYTWAKQDFEGDNTGKLGESTFQPICATLNLHLPIAIFDIYGGPTAAYMMWSDLEIPGDLISDVGIDPEWGWGLSAGVDVSFMRNLAAMGGLRWLKASATPDGGSQVDIDPLFTRLGLAYKF